MPGLQTNPPIGKMNVTTKLTSSLPTSQPLPSLASRMGRKNRHSRWRDTERLARRHHRFNSSWKRPRLQLDSGDKDDTFADPKVTTPGLQKRSIVSLSFANLNLVANAGKDEQDDTSMNNQDQRETRIATRIARSDRRISWLSFKNEPTNR